MEHAKKPRELSLGKKELDLWDFAQYLRRKAMLIMVIVVLAALVSGVYVYMLATPIYEATAQVYVLSSRDSAVNLSDLQIGAYLTEDYQYVFETSEVNQQVIQNLQLPYTVKELRSMMTVTNPSNTRLLFVTVSSTDPVEAAYIANEYAVVASQYISEKMLTDEPRLLSLAEPAQDPVYPRKLLTIAATVLAAMFVSLCILLIAFVADDKIKTSADMKKYLGAMPLAVIPIADIRYARRKG